MSTTTPGGLSGGPAARFTTQNQTTDQRLSHTTVGLVELSDFRKRRAEVLEQQEREARETAAAAKAAKAADKADKANEAQPESDDNAGPPLKKKKKKKTKSKPKKAVSKLSFLGEEEEDDDDDDEAPDDEPVDKTETKSTSDDATPDDAPPPIALLKSFTKQALRRQAAEREALRKEFLARQAAVKAAPVAIPFVFYEGADLPGGVVRVAKGDYVWHFLDRSRKVGARLGVGAAAAAGTAGTAGTGASGSNTTTSDTTTDRRPSKAQMHWARINVDDLMLVRGNLIIPHHYDFYYFIINKTLGPGGVRVFDYTDEPPEAPAAAAAAADDEQHALEGANDDPGLTKVVDRRWYERNKHIFPASVWQEFDPEQDYTQMVRRDQGGNAYFFGGK